MRLLDYIKLAFSNLVRQKVRTSLTVVAITVGSLSLIIMISLLIGIRQSLIDQFQQLGAFNLVTVTKDADSIGNSGLVGSNGDPSDGKMIDNTMLNAVRNLDHVSKATPTATVNVSTMRLEGQNKKAYANLVGYDPANDVFGMNIVAGRGLKSTDMDKIVVSERFTNDIGYTGTDSSLIGARVLLLIKSGAGSAPDWGALPEVPPSNPDKAWYEARMNKGIEIPAEIVGVVSNGSMDNGNSYITLPWAQKLMTSVSWEYQDQGNNLPPKLQIVKDDTLSRQGYSSIIIKVDNQHNITAVANDVTALGYGANTAQAIVDQINRILTLVGAALAVIGGISLFVAAIGIINTMIMATYERTREIGVMRACGATQATIRKLFTFEAAMLGFGGGFLGMSISLILGGLAQYFLTKYTFALGSIPTTEIGKFPWWLIVSVLVFTTLIGILSGLYPAAKAAKLKPVDALRYE